MAWLKTCTSTNPSDLHTHGARQAGTVKLNCASSGPRSHLQSSCPFSSASVPSLPVSPSPLVFGVRRLKNLLGSSVRSAFVALHFLNNSGIPDDSRQSLVTVRKDD